MMPRPGTIRRASSCFGALAATVVLAGCGHAESLSVQTVPTLPPPTPLGMEQMPPEPPLPPDNSSQDCNPTASLRPFATKAEADAAVADIRARGRLIVGLDIGSNLFSFRDPITGEITGFDVDIAGEIAREHLRRTFPCRVPDPVLRGAHHRAAARGGRHRRKDQ